MSTTKFNAPPLVDVGHPTCYRINQEMPLHQLAIKRIAEGRDLKIIITAADSQTGVGKTTLAGWLALNWTWMFAGREWFVDPENPTEGMGTLKPGQYFEIVSKVGGEFPAGTVVVADDCEELDSRRSMSNLNVDFSHRWMLMRLKQVITILTLPSPAALDSRLEELADVWINVTRRGQAIVHGIGVQSYGGRDSFVKQAHKIEFPNVSDHEQLQKLSKMKEDKMDDWDDMADGEDEEEDTGLDKTQQTFLAVARKEELGVPWVEVGDTDPRLEYSGEFYRRKSKDLMENDQDDD